MPRRRTKVGGVADDMAAFASTAPKRTNPTGLARQLRETKTMMKTNEWSGAKASHLVAMYVILHKMVYGVEPEIKGDELKQAKMTAGSFLKTKCSGDFIEAVGYMKWVWARERDRETWRREQHIDGKVLGWRLILKHSGIWTEYRVGQERRKHG